MTQQSILNWEVFTINLYSAKVKQVYMYLLTPMDRATLLHAKSTISLCPLSTITKKRAPVDSKLLHRPRNVGY